MTQSAGIEQGGLPTAEQLLKGENIPQSLSELILYCVDMKRNHTIMAARLDKLETEIKQAETEIKLLLNKSGIK